MQENLLSVTTLTVGVTIGKFLSEQSKDMGEEIAVEIRKNYYHHHYYPVLRFSFINLLFILLY